MTWLIIYTLASDIQGRKLISEKDCWAVVSALRAGKECRVQFALRAPLDTRSGEVGRMPTCGVRRLMSEHTLTLADARTGLQACVELARMEHMPEDVLSAAAYGLEVLKFVEANPDLIKECRRLEREAPEIANVLRIFPGARIVGVR